MSSSLNGSTGGGASAPSGSGVATVSSGAFVSPVPSAASTRSTLGLGSLATASSVTASQISDSTSAGRAVLTAADAAAQRTALGLGGAAVLNVGTTAGTVAAGDAALSNPMSASGDLIVGSAGGAPARLAAGTSGYVLTTAGAGSPPAWVASGAGTPTWLGLYSASALYVGGESATGWASADYATASAAAAAPAFGPGQSLVVCLYPNATPTTQEIIAAHNATSGVRGWYLAVGNNGAARRQLRLYFAGLAGSAEIALTGSDFTVGTAYVIAITMKADKSLRYSVSGGAVQVLAAQTGSYTPPTSADTYDLGSTRAYSPTFYQLTSALIGEVRTYSTEISDADLVAACAGRTTGTIPDVATGTVSTRFLPSDFVGGLRVKAQTGVTWLLKGGASLRPV